MPIRFFTILTLVVSLCFTSGVKAEQSAKPAIVDTIQNQLDALKLDDFERAFNYASPTIKQLFGTPQNFGKMVAKGYPMVHRPADVRFLDLREIAGALYQKVQVQDLNGRIHFLDYQMMKSENGWKINGVQFLGTSDFSA
ncbi:DUF4864 domain-containing protein [Planktotalea sp.]|uniref:DUF4864 domain-containing protein n=1 Tax=Planktotalea sp. TaxID=2029877 RepID=UPI003D6C4894